MRHQRRGQQVVEGARARKEKQHGGHHAHGYDGLDEPIAQLHQVLHKRLLGTG